MFSRGAAALGSALQPLCCLAVVSPGHLSPDGVDVFAFSTNTDVRCPCWTHTDVLRNGLILFFSAEPRGRPPTIHHADGRARRNSFKVYLYPSHLLLCDAFDWAGIFLTPRERAVPISNRRRWFPIRCCFWRLALRPVTLCRLRASSPPLPRPNPSPHSSQLISPDQAIDEKTL